ncbi:MAG: heme o synthase [Caldilineaceae bacterium]
MQLPLDTNRPLEQQIPESAAVGEPLTRESALTRLAISDYVALTKPRIILLLLVTTLVPMFLAAPTPPSGWLVLWVMVGGFLAAGGANTINQYMDRDIDHVMVRTKKRPLPGGRMTPLQVLAFGVGLSLLSVVVLWWAANALTAMLALAGNLFYVFIYTRTLKRTSTQNIVIGGAAGAFPPLVGWAAVAGELSLLPILLFLIVFYWTPPHFWALALLRQREYRAAGVPMLPVVVGEAETHRQILLYSVLLALMSLAPALLQLLGPVYLVAALVLNAIFLKQAWDIYRTPNNTVIWRLYKFSLLYLALLFMAMALDHLFFGMASGLADFHLRLPW